MGKLHEVLAVEPDRKKTAMQFVEEAVATFTKRVEHFTGLEKTYHPDKDDELEQPVDKRPMVTTVNKKLDHVCGAVTNWVDLKYQKEHCNTYATSDLVLEDGTVIVKDVPATFLLGLENDLKSIREMFFAIPTLPPGEEWKKEDGTDLYVSEEKRTRTKKVMKNHVLQQATKEHPAQVQVYGEDERTGLVTTVKKTSVYTPGDKSQALSRIDDVIRAAKKARQRANAAKVTNVRVGRKLFEYIREGKVSEQTKTQTETQTQV